MSWDYTDTYVPLCGRPQRSYAAGKEHEKYCPDCQRELHSGNEEPEEDEK